MKRRFCNINFSALKWGRFHAAAASITVMLMWSCKELYNPPAIRQNPGYLVVDGTLYVGQDSSIILLSRTRNLDSLSSVAEAQANVFVTTLSGQTFRLNEQRAGKYVTDHLNIRAGEVCQLSINTVDGRTYLSDTFRAVQTPAIDSISWRQDSVGVSIYANVNDPQSDARYYRWDYVETWKYQTAFQSLFDYINGQLVYRTPDNQIYYCWKNFVSTEIVLGSTSKLSSNIVNQQLIAVVPTASEKLAMRYSINVKQYALNRDAYLYWQNLKKNTEQLGTLFDVQPSQLKGNIHCISNADEPVMGYISASSVQQKRIFISRTEIGSWEYKPYYNECFYSFGSKMIIAPSEAPRYVGTPQSIWTVLGTVTGGGYEITQLYCGDCREHGGSNKQPDFWKN